MCRSYAKKDELSMEQNRSQRKRFLCTSRYVASENWIKVAENGNKKPLKV
jgi:hypothetical protein